MALQRLQKCVVMRSLLYMNYDRFTHSGDAVCSLLYKSIRP